MHKYALLLSILAYASVALAREIEPLACSPQYVPAKPGYDFTANVDRWGQKTRSYDFTGDEKVGHVYVNALPIFNTDSEAENKALFRWVNRIHPKTRPRVLRDLVLFDEGGRIDNRIIEESERILRDQKYTSDAAVRVISKCDNVVDLEVIAREVWTLVPELKLKTAGGKSESAIGLHDSNFLGSGSQLAFSYARDVDRDKALLDYKDRNLRGSRIAWGAHLEQNSDGYVRSLFTSLPFYELDATRAWGVEATQSKLTEHQYLLGETISAIGREREYFEAWRGHSTGLEQGVARRFSYGMVFDHQRFSDLPGETPLDTMPDDLKLIYPYIQYQQVDNEYGVAYNINQIHHEEDIHMGRSARARFGVSPVTGTRLIFDGMYSDTLTSRNKQLLQASVDWRGRWNMAEHKSEDSSLRLSLDYHRGQTDNRSLYMGFTAVNTWNQSPEKQVLLGGTRGLRGYPIHYAAGDTSYLVTVEQRLFTNYTLFRLFNLGLVAFADTGKAWYRNDTIPNEGWLTDVGVGFRLVPDKTDKDHVIHVDIAYPLKRLPNANGLQFTVEVKKTL